MKTELNDFLTRHDACRDGLSRLAATGAATPEEAWTRADARDLVWAVTRPGVMGSDQRRRFLAEAVLAPVEHLLTDERSLNILRKLRTNKPITQEDAVASYAARAAAYAASSWAAAASASASSYAAIRASDAAYAAASSYAASSRAASSYAAYAASSRAAAAAAAWAAACAAANEAAYAAAARTAAAWSAQARWIRNNFVLTDLNIN
jgi:hypothetical protein